MKKIIAIIYIGILSIGIGFAQENAARNFSIVPKSPIAFQFLRYDELPVSEYTGIPNISIPLYTIEDEGLAIPLTLTYHAGGIKVNQDASWVGLGWDLKLGSIIQIINDRDDFSIKTSVDPYERILPDYLYSSISNYGYTLFPIPRTLVNGNLCGGMGDYNSPLPIQSPQAMYNVWLSIHKYFSVDGVKNQYSKLFLENGSVDSEPDIFKIYLLGETLNVIINFNTNKFVVLNKKGYSVEINDDTWCVKTPTGESFYFTDNSYTTSDISVTPGSAYIGKKTMRIWMLNKIKTNKGKEIIFEYQKSTNELVTTTIHQNEDIKTQEFSPNLITYGACGMDLFSTSKLFTTTIKNKEFQFWLKSIKFSKGIVNFHTSKRLDIYSIATNKLDEIEIVNTNGEKTSSISCKYDYFIDEGEKMKRLKLLSVMVDDGLYNFTYNNTTLPKRNSYQQDYWGYFNGNKSNKSLIPNASRFGHKGDNLDNGNNMSADLRYAKAGILEKIKYPTGGEVSFEYELNQFSNYRIPDIDSLNNKISKGIGLRIKSISHKDHNEKEIKKTTYKYDGGKAILKMDMIASFSRTSYRVSSKVYGVDTEILSITPNGFYGINPLSSVSGVGYSKVTKYISDASNINNGKIETIFNNNPDNIPNSNQKGPNVVSFVSLPAFKNLDHPENGTIKQIGYYDKNNILQKKISFKYKNVQSSIYYGVKISGYANYTFLGPLGDWSNTMPMHSLGFYPIVDFESLSTEKRETLFFAKDSVTTIEEYTYNSNNLKETIIQKDNNNQLFKREYKYLTDTYYHRLSEPVLISQSGKDPFSIVRQFSPVKQGLLSLTKESVKIGTSDVIKETLYNRFDAYSNCVEMIDSENLYTTYIWSYNGEYLVAEIRNAKYTDIETKLTADLLKRVTSANMPLGGDLSKINELRISFPNAHITTYTYKPLVGIAATTDPSGITTYYDYDSFGRLNETYIIEGGVKKIVQSYNYNYKNK